MKTIEINVNSWHYKLIKYCDNYPYSITDICEYRMQLIKSILFCSFVATLVFIACSFVAYGLTNTATWYLAMIVFGTFITPDPAAWTVSVVVVISTIVFSVYGLCKGLGKIVGSHDSQVKDMYDSWKNNWCSKVVFKDE